MPFAERRNSPGVCALDSRIVTASPSDDRMRVPALPGADDCDNQGEEAAWTFQRTTSAPFTPP